MTEVSMVRSFPISEQGGNPAPTVLDANAMSAEDMRKVAAHFGHECGFVHTPSHSDSTDFRFRFFVPNHEMEMCGHGTIGALWALRASGRLKETRISIETLAGRVKAIVPSKGPISVSQPVAEITEVDHAYTGDVLAVLGLDPTDLAQPNMLNSCTSRIKTMIALKDVACLNALSPDFSEMLTLCDKIGSTGLYPFAPGAEPSLFHARQFPRSSGFPEDAATGIAAAALSFSLLRWGMVTPEETLAIRQGEAMGRASEIGIRFHLEDEVAVGCWISGSCVIDPSELTTETILATT